jgi:hypothetical protein
MTTWSAGSLVTSTATFAPADPGADPESMTVTLKYRAPGGAVQSVVYPDAFITRVSEWVYSAELDSTGLPGKWAVQWEGAGSVQAIGAREYQITSAIL